MQPFSGTVKKCPMQVPNHNLVESKLHFEMLTGHCAA